MSIEKLLILNDKTDSVDTPPSGKVYFYSASGVMYSKDSTGTVTPLGGLSVENIQDMLSSFLAEGSTKIGLSYNDAGDVLTIDVVEANIIHQNLSGAGTNTHAQIDSHIANTSNPHSVTKSQVGLGNVQNADTTNPANITQDITHRFVTDTEKSTWNSKEPGIIAGTVAQYWRGDKSFQDLPIAVRVVLLTGLSLVDIAISATDTMLDAFGKLQGQLNQRVSDFNAAQLIQDNRLDVLEATDAEWTELHLASAINNTSNTTYSNISGLAFPVTNGSKYYFEYTIVFRTAATTTGIAFTMTNTSATGTLSAQVNIPSGADGTAALFTGSITAFNDVVTSNSVQTANLDFLMTVRGSFVCTTSGTLTPQFRSEVNGSQVTIQVGSFLLSREFV